MKTIAITGAGGNLGSHLILYLMQNTQWNVIAFSSNVLSVEEKYSSRIKGFLNSQIDSVLADEHIDILIHFAFARRFRSNTDIALSLDFSKLVYEAVYRNPKCRLVNISTVGVYAPSDDFIDEDSPIGPDSLYGMAKYASEVILRSVFVDSIDRTTNLRLGGVAQSQRLIPAFIENAKSKQEINIIGGTQQFSWIDIDDAISAIYKSLCVDRWKPIYNIAMNNVRYSIIEIANIVAQKAKANGYGDVAIRVTPQDIHLCVGWDSSAFMNDTGWTPQISIEQTIDKMF